MSFLPHCHCQDLSLGPCYFLTRGFLYCFTHLSLEPSDPFFTLLLKLFLQNVTVITLPHSLKSYAVYTTKAKRFRKAGLMVWWLHSLWLYLWPLPIVYLVSHLCYFIPICHCEIPSIARQRWDTRYTEILSSVFPVVIMAAPPNPTPGALS